LRPGCSLDATPGIREVAVAATAADLCFRRAPLLLSFLGFAGLVILGVLLVCVGLSEGNPAPPAASLTNSSLALFGKI
jgi:hypothetical protein